MAIFIRERLRHVNDNALMSLQIGCYGEHFQINDHWTWVEWIQGLLSWILQRFLRQALAR